MVRVHECVRDKKRAVFFRQGNDEMLRAPVCTTWEIYFIRTGCTKINHTEKPCSKHTRFTKYDPIAYTKMRTIFYTAEKRTCKACQKAVGSNRNPRTKMTHTKKHPHTSIVRGREEVGCSPATQVSLQHKIFFSLSLLSLSRKKLIMRGTSAVE